MKLRSIDTRASARGLTLIELVVVLAILVALAGLIIGNFPSLLRKASGATSANTIQDIGRAMNGKFQLTGVYADYFDNISGATLPTNCTSQITATAIGAGDLAAFNSRGIANVVTLMAYPSVSPDATWSVSDITNAIPITAATTLAKVTDTALVKKLIPNPSAYNTTFGPLKIYILGVGKNCTLVGGNSSMLESPTRTGTDPRDNSSEYYQRYCAAFVTEDLNATTRKVTFIGAVAPTASGFGLTDDSTSTYNTN